MADIAVSGVPAGSWRDDPQQRRDLLLVALITLAGVALRVSTMLARGLWLDEAISIAQAGRTLERVIETLANGVHPPLFHVLLHYWMKTIGSGEVAIRSYAVIWGVLAIPAAFWAARIIYGRRAGLLAAALVAYSPYHIWYSQEARMYSMMFFFAMMSLGFMALALKTNLPRDWWGYAIFTLLGMFTHYFFSFFVLGEVIYYVLFVLIGGHLKRRRDDTSVFEWRRPLSIFKEERTAGPWLFVMVVLTVLFSLWLSRSIFLPSPTNTPNNALTASAAGSGLGYGQEAPTLAWRIDDVWLVFVELLAGFHAGPAMYAMVAMWPLIISFSLVVTDFMRPVGKRSMLPPVAACGILIIAALGMWQGQVLASRYFIAVSAPAFLVGAAILADLPKHVRSIVIGALIVASIGLWENQSFDTKNLMRYDTREVVGMIVDGYDEGDVVIYEPFYLKPVVTYYLPSTIPSYPFPQYADNADLRRAKIKLIQDLDRITGDSRHVWLILSFQDIETIAGDAYNTLKWFERNGYTVKQHLTLNNVELYEFEAPEDRLPLIKGATP